MYCLFLNYITFSESRYLLLLTRNYAALTFLQQNLMKDTEATVIFGSSFPRDMEYTQVGIYDMTLIRNIYFYDKLVLALCLCQDEYVGNTWGVRCHL